jgi:hypothetical protein
MTAMRARCKCFCSSSIVGTDSVLAGMARMLTTARSRLVAIRTSMAISRLRPTRTASKSQSQSYTPNISYYRVLGMAITRLTSTVHPHGTHLQVSFNLTFLSYVRYGDHSSDSKYGDKSSDSHSKYGDSNSKYVSFLISSVCFRLMHFSGMVITRLTSTATRALTASTVTRALIASTATSPLTRTASTSLSL